MKYWLPIFALLALPVWAKSPAYFSAGVTVSGTVSATHYLGDGSGLTGISGGGGSADRIVSGSTSVIAVSTTGVVTVSASGLSLGSKTVTSWPMTKCATSPDVTLSTTASAFTHGLGATPTMWWVWIRNTSAELGYSLNDVVSVDGTNGTGTGSACGYVMECHQG